MNADQLKDLLEAVASRETPVDAAIARLRKLPYEQLPFATVDHHRAIRCGHPEVIFCQGKTTEQVIEIAKRLSADGGTVLGTRADAALCQEMRRVFEGVHVDAFERTILINPPAIASASPHVALLSAGTADLPVVEEAALTLRSMGVPAKRLNDVGVSGLHRLLGQLDVLQGACAVIVAAGMEGALPSVVGGLVACPVYAVPTSIGYGASFGGLAAMLGMLNSCASNVSVVNIDNGFGAAFSASLVYQQVSKGIRACQNS